MSSRPLVRGCRARYPDLIHWSDKTIFIQIEEVWVSLYLQNANTKTIYRTTEKSYTSPAWDARDIYNVCE